MYIFFSVTILIRTQQLNVSSIIPCGHCKFTSGLRQCRGTPVECNKSIFCDVYI